MDLKALLGDQYKEGMTFAEIEAALSGVVVHTDEEVKANFVAKSLFDTKISSVVADKKKTKGDLDSALERITALETELNTNKRNTMIAETKASLIGQGYDEALAADTAAAMADNDMAKILLNQGKYLAAQKQAIKDELLKGTQPPAAGGTGNSGAFDYKKAQAEALERGDAMEYSRLVTMEAIETSKTNNQ